MLVGVHVKASVWSISQKFEYSPHFPVLAIVRTRQPFLPNPDIVNLRLRDVGGLTLGFICLLIRRTLPCMRELNWVLR